MGANGQYKEELKNQFDKGEPSIHGDMTSFPIGKLTIKSLNERVPDGVGV